MMNILTVSQLNRYVRAVLEEDAKLKGLYVKGEIMDFSRNFRSGHLYFTLRETTGASQASIRAVMFKTDAVDLRFEPEDGMAVLVQARVGLYERDGLYQLYITDMLPDGAGKDAAALELLRRKLIAEGLFDAGRKKPLPEFPGRVGVVTSETGAALKDVMRVLAERNPLCTLVLAAAQVQGAGAAASMTAALKALDERGDCGVIILGRGGGSAEDLSAFNDESLVRAVAAAKTPVISAVGHEVDFTLCDLAADVRAATPSVAATYATRPFEELKQRLLSRRAALGSALKDALRERQQRLDFFAESLYNIRQADFRRFYRRTGRLAELLESLSPLKVLARGYCLTFKDGRAALDAGSLRPGDRVEVKFRDGAAVAKILEVEL